MLTTVKIIYYIICGFALLVLLPIMRKWLHMEYQKRKDEIEAESSKRKYPFPDKYRGRMNITMLIVVPRLPDPYSEEIQAFLRDGAGFILENEYLTVISHPFMYSGMNYQVYCYPQFDESPRWVAFTEGLQDCSKDLGSTYHPVSELWSLEYMNYIETGEMPEGYTHQYTRKLPDHIRNAIINAKENVCPNADTSFLTNLTNPSYQYLEKIEK